MWCLQRHHVWLKQEHVGLFQQSIFSSSWLRNVRVSTLKLVPFKISTTFSRASVRGKKSSPYSETPLHCVCFPLSDVPHIIMFLIMCTLECFIFQSVKCEFRNALVSVSDESSFQNDVVCLSESLPSVIKIWDSDTASVRANDPLPSHVAVIDSFCNA